MKFIVCCFSLLLLTTGSYSQNILWADKVVDFSSELSDKASSAAQVLGKPSKYPNPGRTTCAWSPSYAENRTNEYIKIEFSSPTIAKQLIVVENFNAGHIRKVMLIDAAGIEKQVYERTDAKPVVSGGRLFVLALPSNSIAVKGIKIITDAPDRGNPFQIDAIGISDNSAPVNITINEPANTGGFAAESLGPNVNTASDEVYPVIAPDGEKLYFDRKFYMGNAGAQMQDDIWIAERAGSGWKMAVNPGAPLNNQYSNFICSISPDGNTALVGGNYVQDTGAIVISLLHRSAAGWGAPTPIVINNFKNQSLYNEFSLSADGSTLVISAQTSESRGLLDLYVSFLQADGHFSTPVNLGDDINTAGQEMTPFLAADGKTLYFSSNGYPGYGFQDIYMCRRTGTGWTQWSEPLNLGSAVNTQEWEAYYTVDAKGEYAYFSTSRQNGSNLDIYRIKLPPEARPDDIVWLKGIVTDRTSGKQLDANIAYKSMNDSLLQGNSISTTRDGYAIVLGQTDKFHVSITSPGYYAGDTVIETAVLEHFSELKQNFSLIPMQTGVIIEMKNILFEVNSSDLEDTSYAELDKVVRFLAANPLVEIEVRGHTNNLCDDSYCNSLSGKRAQAVVNYFISKGIASGRLSSKGLGKSTPIADNKTAQGRQANQRVEFMITKVK